MKLDGIDLRILETVERDGRIIKVVLVEEVGLSPTPCWMRLRNLKKAGIVAGYQARVAIRRLGGLSTFIAP